MSSGYAIRVAREQMPLPGLPFQRWVCADGSPFSEFHRLPDGYLLRFLELADFEICDRAASVSCLPAPGIEKDTTDHLFLNQVKPLMLSRQGKLMLHGSAVAFGDEAIAFLAASGRGKSTLAASFAAGGQAFLTDDGLEITYVGQRFLVVPGHPSIRLWADSQDALLTDQVPRGDSAQFGEKSRYAPSCALRFCDRVSPLAALYFLGAGDIDTICIESIAPGDLVPRLVGNSFILDVRDRVEVAAHFERLVVLADKVPGFHLDYPRRYEDLPLVRKAIREHVNKLGGRT